MSATSGLATKAVARTAVFLTRLILRRFRNACRHVLNPLHVYCRLKDLGLPSSVAHRMCRVYERFIFRLFP